MKKLRITVAGKTYDVTVEVLEDDEANYAAGAGFGNLPLPPPAPTPPRPSVPPPTPVVKKGDARTLAAPIAGTILKVYVEAGRHIEEKAPVLLMEAMKMETYIYAPRAGQVGEVNVKPGDTVQAGDPLLRYAEGG
ncbi:MAG: acetyl-CoA carboxylase biotin carboxyl carrier protein subunit [Acidobacteriota bacterium]